MTVKELLIDLLHAVERGHADAAVYVHGLDKTVTETIGLMQIWPLSETLTPAPGIKLKPNANGAVLVLS